ncbi:DHA2 family efflux MFS transporter permease subunit [Deinococcus hopiensis]|uniref:MFS transporter, DHA2 family, lincomycin resistance protein n=1 Tax=Deinococcus hopiensis KR-140 TaxID=695939 RepID=A0A1W1UBJ0_9DEIO|nr:DHA2 family efflux MFS transporter permease subunit [Deinococcus hopiensis]SMB78437.1 MFS transporter, DHA2 family, lincomycin resistance protein [Deinococcus hopiensis KR-140]
MITQPLSAPATAGQGTRNRAIILVLLIASFVVVLNETIMNVALPTMITEFRVTAGVAQWLATAFMLTMAVVIPTTGFLMQRLSSRTVFFLAMGTFTAGTLLAAAAPTFEVLLLARVVQAIGTAIMLPLLFTTVMTLIPAERRGAVMGSISIVIAVAPALGPTVSGLILQSMSWRFMFVFVLPFSLAALIFGARTLINFSEPRRLSLDVASLPLSALGFGGLVYALSRLGESSAGLRDPLVSVPLVLSVLSLALFVWRQQVLQRRDAPLLDFRALGYPVFTLGVVLIMLLAVVFFGGAILLPLYLQEVRGLSTLQTGLLVLPGGVLMGALAPTIGRLYDRHGPALLAVPGGILLTLSLWSLSRITAETGVPVLVALHLFMSLGLAMTFTPLFTAATSPLPVRLYSHGSAIMNTLQQVAGAAGTALLITVMTGRTTRAVAEGVALPLARAEGVRAAFSVVTGVALVLALLAVLMRRASPPAGADADATRVHAGH